MATSVVCNGPVGFTSSKGKMFSIPLDAISFNDGAVELKDETAYDTDKDQIKTFLNQLRLTEIIRISQQAALVPAMVITAKTPGAAANSITITFSNFKTNTAGVTTFDAKVAETNNYDLLTPTGPNGIKAILGTPSMPGKQPGLVLVSSADDPDLPKDGTYQLSGDPATIKIPKNADQGDAFTLQAKSSGADGAHTKITITANPNAKTFTLVADWEKPETGIQVSELESKFDYEIKVSAPPGGTELAIPTEGTIALRGGLDATEAKPASAIVIADAGKLQ